MEEANQKEFVALHEELFILKMNYKLQPFYKFYEKNKLQAQIISKQSEIRALEVSEFLLVKRKMKQNKMLCVQCGNLK